MSARLLTGLIVMGALGTLARYGLQGLTMLVMSRLAPGAAVFPWGTLAVNLLGCLLFGVVWGYGERHVTLTPETRSVLLVGFMGAFTTFSSLIFETGQFLRDSQWLLATTNLLAHNVIGMLIFFVGLRLGAWL